MISSFGGQPISWLDDPVLAFVAVVFVNVWLGVPFYMVMLLGGLQSIPADFYEAAHIDGANARQSFGRSPYLCCAPSSFLPLHSM
ncbi:MAG UNVERIFIED_CONTAM: ABC transporter permease subunit [Anaerolineae bacterium]|jgi:arabinogalactan oligomer/maltooligosaccharide transport system permease protein